MKPFLYILILTLSVNAFIIKKQKNINLPDSFIKDYSQVISYMESACSDSIINAVNDKSALLLKIFIRCDYSNANDAFKHFYKTYEFYFSDDSYKNIIDSITQTYFPRYGLHTDYRFNSKKEPYIVRLKPYDYTMMSNDRRIFYNVICDGNRIASIVVPLFGYSLDYTDNTIDVGVFYYKIKISKNNTNEIKLIQTINSDINYLHNVGIIPILDY